MATNGGRTRAINCFLMRLRTLIFLFNSVSFFHFFSFTNSIFFSFFFKSYFLFHFFHSFANIFYFRLGILSCKFHLPCVMSLVDE